MWLCVCVCVCVWCVWLRREESRTCGSTPGCQSERQGQPSLRRDRREEIDRLKRIEIQRKKEGCKGQ